MWELKKPNKDPSVEKAAVLKVVEALLGRTVKAAPRRRDWRVSASGMTSVFITFSKDDDLWYDVSKKDLEDWAAYTRSFVIFVMGASDDALVLPQAVLQERVLGRIKSKERKKFTLHISGGSRLHFKEVPHVDLDDYRNAFDLLRE